MTSPPLIDEQYALEREAIKVGLKQLQDNSLKLELKDYASASIYGVASIQTLLPLVVQKIIDTNGRIHHHSNGPAFKEIYEYLEPIEPLAAASIAVKLTFDNVFSCKEKNTLAIHIINAIGVALEQECQLRYYEEKAPGLLKTIKEKYWHESCGTQQRFVVTRTMMNRCEVEPWKTWSSDARKKLGGWLLDCVMGASGWFERFKMRKGYKTSTHIVPSIDFLEIKDKVMEDAELFSPCAWPMLVKPKLWSNEERGGYLMNELMKGHDMVRRGTGGLIQGKDPIAFLNKISGVGLRLNPFTVNVALHLYEKGISVGKFIPIVELPLPPKPPDIDTNKESRKSYRRKAAEVRNKNAGSFRRACRTKMTMEAIKRFKDRERFFIPYSFDYRSRAYGIPSLLTPQDTDFGKSLLVFADPSFMNEEAKEWLAFQCATTYGHSLDKSSWDERQQWVKDNLNLIASIARDPIDCLPDWEVADEPFQFLAACDEYYHCVMEEDRSYTSLMVATDATCSGLQILAGMARDKSTAELVNVVPSDRPQDAYKRVAEIAKPNCPESVQPYMDRKTVKRVVMTLPYNSKPFSNRAYIKEALLEKGVEIDKDDLTLTVQAVRDAMHVIVPGPMKVMAWIEKEIAAAIKRGVTEIKWTTPSGFVVSQKLMKKDKPQIIKLQLLGRCELHVNRYTDKPDIARHKAATAPNLIHSLDGCLLAKSAIRFSHPLCTIHDSVLCRATDMSELSRIVRETYMEMFAEHDYLTDFARQIGAETEPPIIDDLKPESVIESTYFFC